MRLELSSGTASTLICIPDIPRTAQYRPITTTDDAYWASEWDRKLKFPTFENEAVDGVRARDEVQQLTARVARKSVNRSTAITDSVNHEYRLKSRIPEQARYATAVI